MNIFKTKDINKRNLIIEKLYKNNIPYSCTTKDNEGYWSIKYDSPEADKLILET